MNVHEATILARRLKEMRQRAQLSQAQLAERAGLSVSMISQIERKERSPTLGALSSLGKALGITSADLISDPAERREHSRFLVDLIEYLEELKINDDEVQAMRKVAKLLVDRRK